MPHDDEEAGRLWRTQLANERTQLAWWRTGFAAIAVALAVGKVVPDLTGDADPPYIIAGAGFGLLGTFLIAYGTYRQRQIERAIQRGGSSPPRPVMVLVLTGVAVVLGLFCVLLVLMGP